MYCAYCAASTMARHNTVTTASTLQIQASVYELLTKLLKKVRVGIVRKSLNCTLCNAREKRSLLSFCFVFHRKYQRAAAVSSWVRRTVNIRNQKITIILFNLSLFLLLSIFSSKRQPMRLSPSLGPHQNCVIVVSWVSAVLRAYQPNFDISSHGSYSFHFYGHMN